MRSFKTTGRIFLAALLVGSGAAVVVPSPPLWADGGCKCDDDGFGQYKCNSAQTACIAGGQICNLTCMS